MMDNINAILYHSIESRLQGMIRLMMTSDKPVHLNKNYSINRQYGFKYKGNRNCVRLLDYWGLQHMDISICNFKLYIRDNFDHKNLHEIKDFDSCIDKVDKEKFLKFWGYLNKACKVSNHITNVERRETVNDSKLIKLGYANIMSGDRPNLQGFYQGGGYGSHRCEEYLPYEVKDDYKKLKPVLQITKEYMEQYNIGYQMALKLINEMNDDMCKAGLIMNSVYAYK